MIEWLKRLFAKPKPETEPLTKPLPNPDLLGIHIHQATRKAGRR